MKRLFLLSAFIGTIIMTASAQYGRGYGRGHGHHPHGNNNVQVIVTRPIVRPQVVYVTPSPVVCTPAPIVRPAPVVCTPAPVYVNTLEGGAFNNALNSIAAQSFDDGKLCVANQILNYNYLYSWQVEQIMYQFAFDSGKLQFAKMAYGKTIDKQNYYTVNNAFTFQSSVRELNNYLY